MRRIFLILVALLYIFPLLLIATNSLMSQKEIERNYGDTYDIFNYENAGQTHYARFSLIPDRVTLSQYNTLLTSPQYLDYFVNSLRLTLPIVVLQLITGTLAAYGFTVWRSRLIKEALFCVYIILMLLPFQATLVSNYIIARELNILNTHLAVILPWGFSPFAAFIMRQSMKGVPVSIFEAAAIDGAGHLRRFAYIALPMVKGGLTSLAILVFTDGWSMVEQPMIFLRDAALAPLSLLLTQLSGESETGLIFAASVVYMLPAVWVFLYGQEYFEQGIKLSALR